MNATFRSALLMSIGIHIALLGSLNEIEALRRDVKEKGPLTIDYVVIKKPKEAESIERDAERKIPETPKVELKPAVDIKPLDTQKETMTDESLVGMVRTEAKTESQIKSTKDYINYYTLIREKIRRRLKSNYKDYPKEGDVYLIFTLDSNGRLLACEIEQPKSTDDSLLLDIAYSSIRESSPFHHFPKGVDLPKISFNLAISFRKR